jgi:hypothetical protein
MTANDNVNTGTGTLNAKQTDVDIGDAPGSVFSPGDGVNHIDHTGKGLNLETLKKFHKMGLKLVPLTINRDGKKIPLMPYRGWKEKAQDWITLQGLYESYKDIKPLHWAVYCVNGIVGLDFDSPKDYEVFFNNIETLTTRSPSGGYHMLLKSLQTCRAFNILGTEIKVNDLITIIGEGYELIKDAPIKELEDVSSFVKNKFPRIKVNSELKEIKISDVIDKFTKKENDFHGGWTAFCPIHGDTTTPHLYIYENTNTFHCFKCKKSGDAISFIKACKSISSDTDAAEYIKTLLNIKTKSSIPVESIEPTTTNIDDVVAEFENNLYIDDKVTITIPISFAIGNFAPCDPDTLGIIAPSGSGKTEVIRALGDTENQFVYQLSSLTSHTFVSGLKDGKDLAPQLKGRLITIKDFTTILSKRPDEVGGIFADIRDVTDGYIQKIFGSEVGKKEYRGLHTSFLFASTNAIERYYSMYSMLGQRLIFFRPTGDAKKARQKAMQNAGHEKDIREDHHKLVMQLVNNVLTTQNERLQNITHGLPDDMIERIGTLCDFLAVVRTHINRDVKGDMCTLPESEMPTRLTKTLCKMVDVHSILYNRMPTLEDELIALRLVHDNIPTERAIILRVLLKYDEPRPTPEIGTEARTPTNMTSRVLNDLMALGIVEKMSRDEAKSRSDMWVFPRGNFKTAFQTVMNLDILIAINRRLSGVKCGEGLGLNVIEPYLYNRFLFNNNINKEQKKALIDEVCNHILNQHPSVNQDAALQSQKQEEQKQQKQEEQKPEPEKPDIHDFHDSRDNITQLQNIKNIIKSYEETINDKRPLEVRDKQPFISWYLKQNGNTISASELWGIVEKEKAFTPETHPTQTHPAQSEQSTTTVEVCGEISEVILECL